MKTKEQISQELNELRKKVAVLEKEWQQAVEEESKYGIKRVVQLETYYTFHQYYGDLKAYDDREEFCSTDNKRAIEFNYFHTKEEAEKVVKHLKAVLKARHLMKVLNGDWKPDWKGNGIKWRLVNMNDAKGFVPDSCYSWQVSPWRFVDEDATKKFIELMGEQIYDLFEVM
jgi:hypothetical protein